MLVDLYWVWGELTRQKHQSGHMLFLCPTSIFRFRSVWTKDQNGGEEAEEGSYQEMFSPVLSHLAAEATSYYAWVLAVTIIIITRRLELKKLPFSRWASKRPAEKRNGTWPNNVSALSPSSRSPSPSHVFLSPSLLHIQRQAFSVSLLKKRQTNEMTCMHTHTYTRIHTTYSLHQSCHKKGFFSLTNTHRDMPLFNTHTHTIPLYCMYAHVNMWTHTIFLSIPLSEDTQTIWFDQQQKNLSHSLSLVKNHVVYYFILWCGCRRAASH